MDKETRNLLFNTTQAIRRLLEEEFALQLEGTFDVHADGRIAEQPGAQLSPAERLVRRRIVEAIQHRQAVGENPQEAVRGFRAEVVFTLLNRLAALKMMEARALVLPSVSQGDQSQGFKEFSGLAPGLIELPDKGYRLYLECLFDEIGREVGVLFDRTDAASQLWPRRKTLESVLEQLNQPDLAGVWKEDETIGWIYQYYNDPEERKQMREESSAPRNSRELAVRNQFFTPRYVVEFLTDNTLGRIWYEMTKGRTRLKEQCRYLVRRPNEIFLGSCWPDMNPAPPGSWVEQVGQGGLSNLPEHPTHEEIRALAFLVDGYSEAERLGLGNVHQYCGELLTAHFDHGQPLPNDLLALWLCLFSCVRGRAAQFFRRCHDPEVLPRLYAAWRGLARSVNEGQSQDPQLQRPALIPPRPIKDPRQIRLLDPACGSMHFGLYAFELLEIIYDEAWHNGVVSKADFGPPNPPGFPHQTVTLINATAVKSNLFGEEIPMGDAFLVVSEKPDGGEGVLADTPYIVSGGTRFRVPLKHRVPLKDFDYPRALRDGWFSEDKGTKLVRESGCFQHADIETEDEVAYARFKREVPRLIVEHNIHGIDIDPRAAQIAGLALWLRAQKSWQRLGLKPADRPAIRRSNIVCAEPMPGEKELLREFVDQQFPAGERPLFQTFLESVWDRMRLAGEAGSLLQIEDEIRTLVAEAKQRWKDRPRFEQITMFTGLEAKPQQQEMNLDVSGITDEQFWEKVEERVYAALRTFAERSESAGGFQRRLFAEDAARGFAFIDLCRQRYDVALMNPPFGDASLPSKPYLDDTYGDTKGDVYKAFVECFHARLVPAGYLGIISSRAGFFLGQSEDWRTRVVLRLFRPIALADLGGGVLDAMVEVAAYVLRSLSAPETRDLTLSIVPMLENVVRDSQDRFSLPKWQAARGGLKRHQAVAELEHLEAHGFIQRSPGDTIRYTPLWREVKQITASPEPVFLPLVCVRALGEEDKGAFLADAIRTPSNATSFVCNPPEFLAVSGAPFSYWISPRIRVLFRKLPQFETDERFARQGLATSDDFRFVRLWVEVPNDDLADGHWRCFAKGGRYSPFYADIPLVVVWGKNQPELEAFGEIKGNAARSRQSSAYYFRPGLTWPLRAKGFCPQLLPAGCIFSMRGDAMLAPTADLAPLLGLTSSSVFDYLFKVLLGRFGFPEFQVGVLNRLPTPCLSDEIGCELGKLAIRAWSGKRTLDTVEPTSHAFVLPALLVGTRSTIVQRTDEWASRVRRTNESILALQTSINDLAFDLYDIDAADRAVLTTTLAAESMADPNEDEADSGLSTGAPMDPAMIASDLWDYTVSSAFGRWDIRYATGEQTAPELLDPFAPLPVCPPGQLQNAQGLPARPDDVPASYPVRIPWDGILVEDPNHPVDLVEKVQEVLRVIWPGSAGSPTAEAIEHEACEILGVKSLRDYFRKPTSFFADHLQRYSKSGRQAPIYWPLSSPHGLYTVWLYYHRLTGDTLFTVLRDHLKPKLEYEERRAFQVRQDAGSTLSPSQRRDVAEAEELVEDLRAFKAELEQVAPLFRPNLNDGVIINYAPLWRMIGLPKWRKDCQAIWNELAKGGYDWAQLAMHLWPERVVPKCATDRSLAIAHGLESVFWQEDPEKPGKWITRKVTDLELRGLIAERTSAAVKAAVESLVELPSTPAKSGRRKNA